MTSWYWALAVYFIGSTANSLLQRRLAVTSKLPPLLITALLYMLFLMPLGLLIALLSGDLWIRWQPLTCLLLLVQAVGIAGFFALAFRLNKRVDATQYVIITNMYTIVTVLLGVLVIHEPFTAMQCAGMVLLLAGGLLVALKDVGPRAFRFEKDSLWLSLASVGLGIGLAAERGSLNYMSYGAYVLVGWGLQTAVLCLAAWRDWTSLPLVRGSDWLAITKLGIARALHNGGFFMSVALSRNVALVATVSSFRIPLVYIASFLLLREREAVLRRFLGVSIATAGLLLV